MTLLSSDRVHRIFINNFDNALLHGDGQRLESRISFHTDLLFFLFDDKTLVSAPSQSDFLRKNTLFNDYNIIFGNEPFSPYPNDVLYNAFLIRDKLFCNTAHTEKLIIDHALRLGITPVGVKQGYAKCSCIKVGENAFVTSDKGIAREGERLGFDVFFTDNDNVLLDGFAHGFIGGASAVYGDKIFFTGDISLLPQFERLCEFFGKYGMTAVHCNNYPLYDFGSPIILT